MSLEISSWSSQGKSEAHHDNLFWMVMMMMLCSRLTFVEVYLLLPKMDSCHSLKFFLKPGVHSFTSELKLIAGVKGAILD